MRTIPGGIHLGSSLNLVRVATLEGAIDGYSLMRLVLEIMPLSK